MNRNNNRNNNRNRYHNNNRNAHTHNKNLKNTRNNNSQDYNVVLKNLQDYMLANDVIEKSIHHIDLKYTKNINYHKNTDKKQQNKGNFNSKETKSESKIIFPKYNDSLFWCFYILSKSLDDYTMMEIGKKQFEIEKTSKIDLVSIVREKKDEIKKIKLKRTDIENELVNESAISINTFLAICMLKDLHVIIVKNKIFYELGDGNETHIIIFNEEDNKYGIDLENNDEKINKYRNTLWKVENISKPVRAMSYYKIADLQEICQKIDIPLEITLETKTKNKTKAQLYEEIVQKLT